MSSLAGRSDLLRVLARLGEAELCKLAPTLGYEDRRERSEGSAELIPVEAPPVDIQTLFGLRFPERVPPAEPAVLYPVIVRRELREPENSGLSAPAWLEGVEPLGADENPSWRAPPWQALVPWARLLPWLRRRLGSHRPTREPDLRRLLGHMAAGRTLRRVPELTRRGWAARVCVLLDYAPELWPYREDMNRLWRRLEKLRGANHVDLLVLQGPPGAAPEVRKAGEAGKAPASAWRVPPPGTPLLVLSDLGMLGSDAQTQAGWQHFGLAQARAGVAPVALCPVPAGRVPARLAHAFDVHEWDAGARLGRPVRAGADYEPARIDQAVEAMLDRLAPALWAEAPLLRAVRRGLGAHAMAEWAIQHHADAVAGASRLFPASIEARDRRLARFADLPRPEQRRMAELLYAHHGGTPSRAMTERRVIESATRELADAHQVLREDEIDALRTWQRRLLRRALDSHDSFMLRTWLPDNLARQGDAVVAGAPEGRALKMLALRETLRDGASPELPQWASDPELRYFLEAGARQIERRVLVQRGPCLYLEKSVPATGVVLAEAGMLGEHVHISYPALPQLAARAVPADGRALVELNRDIRALAVDTGLERLELVLKAPPTWAAEVRLDPQGYRAKLPISPGRQTWLLWVPGHDAQDCHWLAQEAISGWQSPGPLREDRYGLYAEFSVGGVSQRVRWIAPGSFLMGSPEGEAERDNDEGPQHEVSLSGFWLADTACTQALWEAVMGDNPSHFKDDLRNPVEQVSWDDCQKFFARLNERVPGLGAGFASEAQWEYACRAGTGTPFSIGENITTEQVNYRGTGPYAGGKKGEYREKTVPAGSLPANAWGLYEMHGNVLEWCSDWYGKYSGTAQTDPEGPDQGRSRVLRGGCWIGRAADARSACRNFFVPGYRYDYVGLRVAPGRAGPAEPA